MFKVCFISTVPATMKGLILPFVNYVLEKNKGNVDITLICSPDDDFAESLPSSIHFYPVKMKRGVDIHLLSVIRQFKRIFKTEKFDLIQYSTPNASFYSSIAAKSEKIPVRLYCQWGLAFEGYSGLKNKIFKWLEKTTCKNSTWIEPDSNGNLARCRTLGFYDENKSSVVLFGSAKGVNLSVFDFSKKCEYRKEIRDKYRIADQAFVFGFAGSITGDKGINELLCAFRMLLKDYPNTMLMLVGDTEKEASLNTELFEWAKECCSIIFVGLSHAVQKEMAAMDCYVIPSYREGFGTTVIEAGAMGLPVISTDIPGPTDAIKDGINGLLVEKKNIEQLADAMIKMVNDPSLCEKFGAEGLKLVREKYDQQKVFDAIIEDRKRLLKSAENNNG